MVDLVGRALVQLAKRIVRQFGEIHDRVETFDILWRYPAHVPGEGQRLRTCVVVKPAIAIETAIHTDDVEPLLQRRPEHGANIPVGAGNQYPLSYHVSLAKMVTVEISCDRLIRYQYDKIS